MIAVIRFLGLQPHTLLLNVSESDIFMNKNSNHHIHIHKVKSQIVKKSIYLSDVNSKTQDFMSYTQHFT